jgi:hypothetical protein
MPENYSHPSGARQGTAAPTLSRQDTCRPAGIAFGDLPAIRRAGRSCCCSARPMVVALIPASSGRRHQTDLLLCGHHYRASRQALAAAGATVVDLDGVPVTGSHWSPEAGPE